MRAIVVAVMVMAAGQALADGDDYFTRSIRLGDQINDDLRRSAERREMESQRTQMELQMRQLESDNQRLREEMQRRQRY